MREALLGALKPVKTRQQSVFTIHCLFAGLLVAAIGGLAGASPGWRSTSTCLWPCPPPSSRRPGRRPAHRPDVPPRRPRGRRRHRRALRPQGPDRHRPRVRAPGGRGRPEATPVRGRDDPPADGRAEGRRAADRPADVALRRRRRAFALAMLVWPLSPKQAEAGPATTPKAVGKVCNTPPTLAAKACPKPLARLALKC